jgi:hypothetical protein
MESQPQNKIASKPKPLWGRTYKLSETVLNRDYHGCGKAWAAIKNGEVIAIRYMGDDLYIRSGCENLLAWIKAVDKNCEGLDSHFLPTVHSSKGLSKMAQAAESAGDCPQKPRGGRYRPKELLTMARAALTAAKGAAFAKHRETARAELALLGNVISGMCSCTEFVAKG